MPRTVVATQRMFMTLPAIIISEVRMPEAEYTMALGGVATGSMKAKLQVTAIQHQ